MYTAIHTATVRTRCDHTIKSKHADVYLKVILRLSLKYLKKKPPNRRDTSSAIGSTVTLKSVVRQNADIMSASDVAASDVSVIRAQNIRNFSGVRCSPMR